MTEIECTSLEPVAWVRGRWAVRSNWVHDDATCLNAVCMCKYVCLCVCIYVCMCAEWLWAYMDLFYIVWALVWVKCHGYWKSNFTWVSKIWTCTWLQFLLMVKCSGVLVSWSCIWHRLSICVYDMRASGNKSSLSDCACVCMVHGYDAEESLELLVDKSAPVCYTRIMTQSCQYLSRWPCIFL